MSAPATNIVKRLDHVFDKDTRTWSYRDTKDESTPLVYAGGRRPDGSDSWKECCFVIVRGIPADPDSVDEPDVVVTIKSPHLRAACKHAIGDAAQLGSWMVEPLELPIHTLIWAFPRLTAYHLELQNKQERSHDDDLQLNAVAALLDYLREDHGHTIARLDSLLAQQEITFNLLYAILIPGTLFLGSHVTTEEVCVVQLKGHTYDMDSRTYTLHCEGVDAVDSRQTGTDENLLGLATLGQKFGKARSVWTILYFDGVTKINTLPLYPIGYHSKEANLRDALIARGRKWANLYGMHHATYKGKAKYNGKVFEVDSRIMVDRDIFRHYNPSYSMDAVFNEAEPTADTLFQGDDLTDDDLLLTPPTVYGFGLLDRRWLEFNVTDIGSIEWDDVSWDSLVLLENQRDMLRCLVQTYHSDAPTTQREQSKTGGLVINICGPSGVGKTRTTELISEHLKRPLYKLTIGQLGDYASSFEDNLEVTFKIATRWGAILLVDEADMLLEQRSVHDVQRNALLSIFWSQLERFRGCLFLTSSRVQSLDPTMLSHINMAVNLHELNNQAKLKVWRAALRNSAGSSTVLDGFACDELDTLANRKTNGRQITKAVQTAELLASARGERLGYAHIMQALDAMEGFERELTVMARSENWYL